MKAFLDVNVKFDTNEVQATLGLRYGNIRKIGAGGMGCVFSVYDAVLARPVAVKLLSSAVATNELSVRFQQEAKLASRLHHPNIVTVMDFGRGENGVLFLIMDLVEGSSLAQVIKESGGLPLDQALHIFIQICDALAHAHGQGVVHRDLKPSNVMLAEEAGEGPAVRIVDFGLAKVISEDHKITKTGVMIGTPLYSSPEQFQSKPIDQRTDIYSFGCLMFAALTGKPPFLSANQFEVYDMHLNKPVPSLMESSYAGGQTEALDKIIATAMAKDRSDRYQSFYQLKSDLIALLPEESRLLALEQDADDKYAKNRFKASSFVSQHRWPLLLFAVSVATIGAAVLSRQSTPLEPKAFEIADRDNALPEEQNWKFFSHMKDGLVTWTNIDCRMSDNHFKALKGKGVRSVMLYAMRFKGYGLRYLVGEPLERLEMAESKIVDANLHYIGDLKELQVLDLSYTWITDKGLETIGDLPLLRDLGMAGCTKLTSGSIDSMLRFAPNIDRLSLSYTPVGRAGYEKLTNFQNLRNLNLEYSDLTDEMIEPIFKLDLAELNLSKNKNLTDITLNKVKRMKHLTSLKISECPKITEKAVAELKQALPKCSIMTIKKETKKGDFFL